MLYNKKNSKAERTIKHYRLERKKQQKRVKREKRRSEKRAAKS